MIEREDVVAEREARDDLIASRCARIMRRLVLLELSAIAEVERLLERLGA